MSWGDFGSGGFCPGEFGSGGFCPRGILSGGILSGGILTGGFCPGGFCPVTLKCITVYKTPRGLPFSTYAPRGDGGFKFPIHFYCILHAKRGGGGLDSLLFTPPPPTSTLIGAAAFSSFVQVQVFYFLNANILFVHDLSSNVYYLTLMRCSVIPAAHFAAV